MKKCCFLLAGVALLAGQGRGQVTGLDPAQLYELNPAVGPWLIFTMDYRGPQARQMGLKLIQELRNTYQLPAYIFNFADEEQQKERTRVADLRKQQLKFLEENHLDPGTALHIRTRRFEDQYAVLIGGFKDRESALLELKRLRKLKPPDPTKVAVPTQLFINPKDQKEVRVNLSPFDRAFVVPNPTIKQTPREDRNKPDPDLLKFNEGETYNLLKCPRRCTLAIAQFHGASTVETTQSPTSSFMKQLRPAGHGESVSASAMSAHSVAEMLHKLNLEAYVLHTRYYSVVTVGGFDNPDDPRVGTLKNQIASLRLNQTPLGAMMLPEPQPMMIPRP